VVKTLISIDVSEDAYWKRDRCVLCVGKKTSMCVIFPYGYGNVSAHNYPVCHRCCKVYRFPLPDHPPSEELIKRCFFDVIDRRRSTDG
jgi:hypothetical protein